MACLTHEVPQFGYIQGPLLLAFIPQQIWQVFCGICLAKCGYFWYFEIFIAKMDAKNWQSCSACLLGDAESVWRY